MGAYDLENALWRNECLQNEKTWDSGWSSWSRDQILDTDLEWKRWQTRECRFARLCEDDDKSENILEWLKFPPDVLKYDEAASKCKDLGGHLFTSLNGSESQLEFLFNKVGQQEFWLGVTTSDPSEWVIDIPGVTHEDILWFPGEPNNKLGANENRAVAQCQEGSCYVSDVTSWLLPYAVVCEMPTVTTRSRS